jgi:outer membrane protein OmpA-like peptidoglycan-associated protein
VAAAALALAPATAQAQASRDLELSTFVPPPGTEIEGFTVESPAVGVDGAWSLSLAASHATNVLQVEAPSIGMTDRPITSRTALQVGFAYAFLGQFEAGVRAPFYTQQGDEPMFSGLRPAGGATLGDVALHGKARLLGGPGGGPLALGASIDLTLPTAGDDRYAGVLGPSGHVRALASWGTRRFGANANLGFIGRRRVSLGDLRQGNALSYGAGAWFRALEKMWVVGEAFGSVGLGDAGPGLTQLEAVVGVRYEVTSSIGVSAGAGRGVLTGIGSPDLRGFLLVDVAPRAREPGPLVIVVPPPPRDERDDDGDTVVNADDGCPRDAEDADGFEDADGCPEADNDGDGVLDELDQCVAEPEDADGFKDDDGCPDDDNDGDGIADAADKCPGEAEDLDGYLDGDGCDEPDNDGDGIPDLMDQCAIEAEVINGNSDDDGCPDSGDSLVMVMPDRIEIFEPVVFQGGGATLVKKSAGVLGQVAATMRANPDFKRVRVTVHVHPRDGGDQDLSERRAKAVRDWLVKWGVEPERVDARGMGSTRPLVPKTQKGAADLNDRVEFIILEKAVK